MSAVWAITAMVAHHLRRDRSAVFFLVVLPVGLMYVLGNIYVSEADGPPVVAVTVDDTSRAVGDVLVSSAALDALLVDRRETVEDLVRRREVDAGVVVAQGRPVELVAIPDVELAGGVRLVVGGLVTRAAAAERLVTDGVAADADEALTLLPPPPSVTSEQSGFARTEAAIGVLVLMVFMNLIVFASVVPSHRQLGVLDRVGASPVNPASVAIGYAVAFWCVACVQLVVMLMSGRALLGIQWGPTLQVFPIVVGLAVAAAGVASLGATLFPSPESGSSIGGPVGFALGMLGGCLWPLDFVGGPLATIGRWIPHHWAVEGFASVALHEASSRSIAGATVALVGAGVASALFGAFRFHHVRR